MRNRPFPAFATFQFVASRIMHSELTCEVGVGKAPAMPGRVRLDCMVLSSKRAVHFAIELVYSPYFIVLIGATLPEAVLPYTVMELS
jgi:hypothetical protein